MAKSSDANVIKDKVLRALDKIRPHLQLDGGDVNLIDISKDGVVKVELTGACHGCPFSQMTLRSGIREAIMKDVPEIKDVIES